MLGWSKLAFTFYRLYLATCQTHFMRNLLDAAPKSLQGEIYRKVREILDAPDLDTARLLLDQMLSEYADKAPKALQVLEDGFDDATAVLSLPERYASFQTEHPPCVCWVFR